MDVGFQYRLTLNRHSNRRGLTQKKPVEKIPAGFFKIIKGFYKYLTNYKVKALIM